MAKLQLGEDMQHWLSHMLVATRQLKCMFRCRVHQGVLRLRVPKVLKPEPEIQTVPID